MRWIMIVLALCASGCGGEPAAGGAGGAEGGEAANAERVDDATARRIREEQAAAERKTSGAAAFTKVFKHPVGIYFYYPEGWRTQAVGDQLLRVLPPDVGKEEFLVYGEHAGGHGDPAAPEVVQYLEQGIQQLFPALRRDGGVTARAVGPRKAAVFDWKGTQEGTAYRGRTWITIVQEYAIAVLIATPEASFDERARVGEELVATVAYEKPESDPRLVGKWMHEKVYMSGGFSAVTVRYLFLHADGTCREGGRVMAGMQHTDSGGDDAGDTHADSGGGDVSRGRWSTSGRTIRLDWNEHEAEEWEYVIQGPSMLFRSGRTKKLWKRR